MDIGLPDTVPLLALNDLDNYLFPLVPKLIAATGRQLASVWELLYALVRAVHSIR